MIDDTPAANTAENDLIDLQRHSAAVQDARISNLETKFEMFMQSVKETTENLKADLKDFKDEIRQQNADLRQEMRERDDQRHAENVEIRNAIKEIYTTTDAKITDIKNTIDSTNKHIQNFSIAAFVGVGAMAITSIIGVSAMVYSILNK